MPDIQLTPQLNIHYLDPNPSGSPTVLLLHGLGATCESWGLQMPALVAAGYRPLAADGRGFGRSTLPRDAHRIREMADDMARLLAALGKTTDAAHGPALEPVHVVGISMGGVLALQLALDQPQLVKKLTLVNTFASLRPEKLSAWAYFATRLVMVHTLGLEAQARLVSRRLFPDPAQAELRQIFESQVIQADPRGYRAAMRALARFNVVKRLAEIRIPTLVISGAEDTTVPLKNQQVLVERIPGARHVIIAGAGHAVTAQAAERFNQELLQWLGDESAAR